MNRIPRSKYRELFGLSSKEARAIRREKLTLHSFEELGQLHPLKLEVVLDDEDAKYRYSYRGEALIHRCQYEEGFIKVFDRPVQDDLITDDVVSITDAYGNLYEFRRNVMFHHTDVTCNGTYIAGFHVCFSHVTPYRKFCEWVVAKRVAGEFR